MTRDERIARAAQVIGVRYYSVDMDRPTMVMFEIAKPSTSIARAAAVSLAAALTSEGIPAGYGSPRSGAGTWYHVTITVQVGR